MRLRTIHSTNLICTIIGFLLFQQIDLVVASSAIINNNNDGSDNNRNNIIITEAKELLISLGVPEENLCRFPRNLDDNDNEYSLLDDNNDVDDDSLLLQQLLPYCDQTSINEQEEETP